MRHHSIKDAHIEEIACIDPLQPRAYIIPFGGTLVFLHDYSHQIQQKENDFATQQSNHI